MSGLCLSEFQVFVFLDFQGPIWIIWTIARCFKRRCCGDIGISAFFQPGAESLIFVPGQARDNEIRVRLIRKDLIQSHGKIIRVFGGGIMELLCDNDIIVIGLSMGE